MRFIPMLCKEPTAFSTLNEQFAQGREIKYSSTYGGTYENYIVGLSGVENTNSYDARESVLCVVQNIIQRGNPTPLSEYLNSRLARLSMGPDILVNKTSAHWHVIKSDDKAGYDSAQYFYENLMPKYMGDYRFVQQLMLIEVKVKDVLPEIDVLDQQTMDFYLPQAKLNIEIDSLEYKKHAQQIKNEERDKILQGVGIHVIRIKTNDLQSETRSFKKQMADAYAIISNNQCINQYRNPKCVMRDTVMRLQMALLSALRYHQIAQDSARINICIKDSDIKNLTDLLEIAYGDLCIWITKVSHLAKVDISMPKMNIIDECDENTILLDFNMCRCKSDTDDFALGHKVLYVRTEYKSNDNYYYVASAEKIYYHFPAATQNEDDNCLHYLLRNIFNHNEFRGGQLPIIKHALACKDTIGILPTGTGKSLCYQMVALLQPGVTLVTVPIIALMQDQKKGMEYNGISQVAYISSGIVGKERDRIMDDFTRGKYQFMMLSPERTQNKKFINSLKMINKSINFSYAVIDEVHCLSEWGHDFRVAYLRLIPTLRKYCSNVCFIGLTATASQAVLDDLKAEFDIDGTGIKALSSMDRPELDFTRYVVKSDEERELLIEKIIKNNNVPYADRKGIQKNSVGLIFCRTANGWGRKPSCAEISRYIRNSYYGFEDKNLLTYTGKMTPGEKRTIQDTFMDKSFDGVMVCTQAFGMGIDKENIRYTIHTSLPNSIESFYQEAGRAGRDEDKSIKSHCYLLYLPENNIKLDNLNKIFQLSTSVDERKTLSNQLTNDLNTIMYLWNRNRQNLEEEYKGIYDVLDMLVLKGLLNIPFYTQDQLDERQNSLYKLALLDIVGGWTVEYTNGVSKGNIYVQYEPGSLNLERIKMALLRYIHKHDTEFTLDGSVKRYQKYYDLFRKDEKKPVKNLIEVLIEWGNDNIVYNRLQSTYNMMELCSQNVTDEQFRTRINDYFRYTDEAVIFETIIQNPLNYHNWMQIIFQNKSIDIDNLISMEDGRSLLSSLLRYLESYGNNTGLNYLSGILRILCSDFERTEGEWRLRDSLENMKETMPKDDFEDVFNITLVIASSLDEARMNQLSSVLVECYLNRAEKIYRKLNDYSSLAALIKNQANTIRKIMEDNTTWII